MRKRGGKSNRNIDQKRLGYLVKDPPNRGLLRPKETPDRVHPEVPRGGDRMGRVKQGSRGGVKTPGFGAKLQVYTSLLGPT